MIASLLLAAALSLTPESDADVMEAAARLSGAACVEDLSEDDAERCSELAAHPVDLNASSVRRLMATGLFTRYQAASLADYISRNGDILSLAELASVDGIGRQTALDLSHFISLRSALLPGELRKNRFHAENRTDISWKTSGFGLSDKLEAGWGPYRATLAYKEKTLKGWGVSAEWRKAALCIGDYNVRYGQGLLLWTGMTMTGVPTAASLCRSATGVRPANSFNPSGHFRGAAASAEIGRRFGISAFADMERRFGGHLEFTTRRGTYGIGAYGSPQNMAASADWLASLGKWTIFGEAAADIRTGGSAAVAGIRFEPGWKKTLTVLVRSYSPRYGSAASGPVRSSSKASDEQAVSAGLSLPWLEWTSDAARHPSKGTSQYKTRLQLHRDYCLKLLTIKPSVLLQARCRPEDASRWRVEGRFDLGLERGPFLTHFRCDFVRCSQWAWMWYLEAGYNGVLAAYLRFELFKADEWNDRIYVYERDGLGSFNVPALYGRGYCVSMFARFRGVCVRVATTQYPWTAGKSGKYEVKIQLPLKTQNLKPRLRPRPGEELPS